MKSLANTGHQTRTSSSNIYRFCAVVVTVLAFAVASLELWKVRVHNNRSLAYALFDLHRDVFESEDSNSAFPEAVRALDPQGLDYGEKFVRVYGRSGSLFGWRYPRTWTLEQSEENPSVWELDRWDPIFKRYRIICSIKP